VVNDSCGHQAGDELLRNISIVLKNLVRSEDILARLGGDEFGLILNNCTLVEAQMICEKILAALSKHRFRWQDEVFSIGASIGVLVIDNSSGTSSELLRQADSACYVAKDRGRNCVHVFTPTDAETERRGQLMRWLSRLNWAFENDSFELYAQKISAIQPQHSHLEFYEFLVRMIDENGALIPPGAFIPAAEYYGLSSKMDRWVTKQSILLARKIDFAAVDPDGKHNRIYFINLSGLTLGDKKFVEEITELLDSSDHRNFKICFEITETAAIQNMAFAIEFMQHFRELGCLFALDDFGSGFSSFSYLKALPIDFLKIDGAFVKAIMSGPSEFAIVKSIHEIAKAFGMRTIAEHIETLDVLDQVRDLGIDFAQGYYLHKPSPIIAGKIP
jgi:ammonium transporter, Amt family